MFCVHRLERAATAQRDASAVGDGRSASAARAFAALPELIRSPYLLGVGRLGQPAVVRRDHPLFRAGQHRLGDGARRGAQTRIFASIDLAVGLLTLATQVFATGQLLKRFGTGVAAGALPAVYVVGFAALALAPTPRRRGGRSRSCSAG